VKKRTLSARELDARIDALLAASPAKPSATFTSDTIAKARAFREADDPAIDALLAAHPVKPSADFTRRTVMLAVRKNPLLTFLRPALAAAASVALCLGGIRVWESPAAPEAAMVAQSADMEELMALARSLDEAAPLLEGENAETLASLVDPSR
jgi:hypothetical protein